MIPDVDVEGYSKAEDGTSPLSAGLRNELTESISIFFSFPRAQASSTVSLSFVQELVEYTGTSAKNLIMKFYKIDVLHIDWKF